MGFTPKPLSPAAYTLARAKEKATLTISPTP